MIVTFQGPSISQRHYCKYPIPYSHYPNEDCPKGTNNKGKRKKKGKKKEGGFDQPVQVFSSRCRFHFP